MEFLHQTAIVVSAVGVLAMAAAAVAALVKDLRP